MFERDGFEFAADKEALQVLDEMEWSTMDVADKERIAVYWVDHLLHPISDILWTPYDESGAYRSEFGASFNPLYPTFTHPTAVTTKDGSVTIVYWEYDQKSKNARMHRVVFGVNGAIVERTIINSNDMQFMNGFISTSVVLVSVVVSFVALKAGLLKNLWK
eukprot:gene7756-9095_t